MLRHTSAAKPYSASSYHRSLYVFVIYGSSEGGESLFMLCCQGDNKFVFIMLG